MYLKKQILYYALALIGFFFSFSRVIRHGDYFLIVSYLAFLILIIVNIKVFLQIELRISLVFFTGFSLWSFITIFWAQTPVVSLLYSLYFIFAVFVAIILASFTLKNKISFWEILFISNVIFVIINILSCILGIPQDAWTANHGKGFTGIFKHQNSLASTLLFTLPGLISFFFYSFKENNFTLKYSFFKNDWIKNNFFIYTIILIFWMDIYLIIISHSRTAVIAIILGLLVYVFLDFKVNLSKKYFFAVLLFIIINMVFSESILKYFKKGDTNFFATREVIWTASFKAAEQHFIVGCGFGNSSKDIILKEGDSGSKYVNGWYFREKGNGILALIEETGLVGVILFFLPFGFILRKIVLVPEKMTWEIKLVLSSLVSFLFHLQFESWITSFHFAPRLIFLIMMAWILQYVTLDNSEKFNILET